MTYDNLVATPELTAVTALAGLMTGFLYFAALRRSVRLLVGGRGWLAPLALTLGRIGAAAGLLFVAANLGQGPLLGGFAGFLTARALVLRALKRVG